MKNAKAIGLGILGGLIPLSAFLILQTSNTISHSSDDLFKEGVVNARTVSFEGSSNAAPDFVAASKASLQSVVHIKTKVVQEGVMRDPLMEFFYGPGVGRKQQFLAQGSGSGVVVSPDGYIVTNNHVVEGASNIEVVFDDKSKYDAKVIGTDPSTDVAVLKIEAENLKPIAMGNSDNLNIGEWVLAVGNPFNLTSTVTAGIVSAKGRNINLIGENSANQNFPIESFIQTDAAVNPGNSGGALVNTRGELVGINTAIASETGSYAGYSFAIPVNLVKKVVKDIIDFGVAQRGFLGLQISDVTQEIKEKEDFKTTEGVYIAEVVQNSGAAIAGIKKGEVILKVGSKDVNKAAEVLEEVGQSRPGDTLMLSIRHKDGSVDTRHVVLQNENGGTQLVKASTATTSQELGATFSTVSPQEMKELGISNGVKISKLEAGKLKSLGLKEGMIITKVNNDAIYSVPQLMDKLKQKSGGILLEIVNTNGRKEYIGFGL